MPKMIHGNSPEVARFGLLPSRVEGLDNYEGSDATEMQIKLDTPRTCVVDGTGNTFETFKNDTEVEALYERTFKQGDFSGGRGVLRYLDFFSIKINELYAKAERLNSPDSHQYKELTVEAERMLVNIHGKKRHLTFAYRNNQGHLCGFGLCFNPNNPKDWVIDISQNTTLPVDQQTTTLFTGGELENMMQDEGTSIHSHNLPGELSLALNSPYLNQLIAGLVDTKGRISLDKFDELDSRINPNQNIDNRDEKQAQLKALFEEKRRILGDNEDLEQSIKTIEEKIKTDPNFFIDENFAITIQNFHEYVQYTQALETFNRKIEAWENTTDKSSAEMNLLSQAKLVRNEIKTIKARHDENPIEENSLPKLTRMLNCCASALDKPVDKLTIAKLTTLSQEASGKGSPAWKKLGASLLIFAGLALIVAGVLAAIPTGGASLFLAALGTSGVSAATAIAGAGIFKVNSAHGLAKASADFKSALVAINPYEAPITKEDIDSGLGSDTDSGTSTPPSTPY